MWELLIYDMTPLGGRYIAREVWAYVPVPGRC